MWGSEWWADYSRKSYLARKVRNVPFVKVPVEAVKETFFLMAGQCHCVTLWYYWCHFGVKMNSNYAPQRSSYRAASQISRSASPLISATFILAGVSPELLFVISIFKRCRATSHLSAYPFITTTFFKTLMLISLKKNSCYLHNYVSVSLLADLWRILAESLPAVTFPWHRLPSRSTKQVNLC